uniref:JmjC domain-containing protein n=1 Tax=Palpitomonas bilix TaxID=652834 RepID=A0A7S3G240_9EUKA
MKDPASFEEKFKAVIEEAKKDSRSEVPLHEWDKQGYAYDGKKAPAWNGSDVVDTIERVHCRDLTVEDFVEKYEKRGRPVIIKGIADGWPAMERWTLERLEKEYRNEIFKVGEDDDGYRISIKMKYFMEYLRTNKDDSPLYIFDSKVAKKKGKREEKHHHRITDDFEVPKYFREDLLQYAGKSHRPPYRWFLVGPKRSGTNVHIDPLGTSAWNTLISGRKRWVVFPFATKKSYIKPGAKVLGDGEAITWFSKLIPQTRKPEWPTHRPIEFIQYPGETIFVPGGLWHAVLNIDDTVAITQNYCSSTNFEEVFWKFLKSQRKLAMKAADAMKNDHPSLYAVAQRLIEKREERREQKRKKEGEWEREMVTKKLKLTLKMGREEEEEVEKERVGKKGSEQEEGGSSESSRSGSGSGSDESDE